MRRGGILNLNESLNTMECDPGGGGGGSELKQVVNRVINMDRKVLIQRMGRRLRYNGLSAMLVLGVVLVMGFIGGGGCFVVSEGGSSSSTPTPSPTVGTAFPVLVGDFSISHVNKTEEDSGKENVEEVNKKPPITVTNLIGNSSLEDLGIPGSVSSTTPEPQRESEKGDVEKEDGNCTKGHEHVDHSENKIEQILWDIFVEEDDDSTHDDLEEDDEESPRSDDPVNNEAVKYREDKEESTPDSSESTFEDMLSDSIALHEHEHAKYTVHHGISKRSVVEEEDDEVGRSSVRRHHPVSPSHPHNQNRGNKKYVRPTNKKYNRPQQPHGGSRTKGQHRVSSRRHTRPNTKTKKKAPTNVSKYNDYMDVVLKRMNSMIKTKHMDPLMVNLFSGGQQQQGKPVKPQDKPKDPPKKKKKGYTGRKKRKGAKNKGRMEELHELDEDDDMEARSVSSSESSSTVELDGVNGVQGIGGVLIRRVGVLEEGSSGSDEEELDDEGGEDDDGEEEGEERGFREIRALIVNGSMKRSNGEESSNDTQSSSEPTTSTTTTTTQSPKKSSSETTSPQETRGFDKSPSSTQDTESSEESSRKKDSSKNKKDSNKNKNNKNNSKKKQPEKKPTQKPKKKNGKGKATRGVLKGLSSLKRYGDVDVVRQTDNVRIVRGRFKLGPVTLEIVPKGGSGGNGSGKGEEEGRKKGGSKNKQKSSSEEDTKPSTPKPAPKVTAIARELKGIIEVRLKKNSPTTIKRLRVFPPSSVKIKSNGKSPSEKPKGSSVPRYNRVTPVATHRLRQIASAVVRQADVKRKSSGLGKGKVKS